jgi:hypothetical protein
MTDTIHSYDSFMTPVFLLYNPQTASDNLFFVFGGPSRLFVKQCRTYIASAKRAR